MSSNVFNDNLDGLPVGDSDSIGEVSPGRGVSANDIKSSVKLGRVSGADKDLRHERKGKLILVELIRCGIDYEKISVNKPCVGIRLKLAGAVMKLAVKLILKISGEDHREIATSPVGEIMKSDEGERYRFSLYESGSEIGDGLEQLVAVSLNQTLGKIFIHRDYPSQSSFDTNVENNMEKEECK